MQTRLATTRVLSRLRRGQSKLSRSNYNRATNNCNLPTSNLARSVTLSSQVWPVATNRSPATEPSNQLRRVFRPRHRLKLDRHDDFSVVIFWTIYTSTDRPRPHSVCRKIAGIEC